MRNYIHALSYILILCSPFQADCSDHGSDSSSVGPWQSISIIHSGLTSYDLQNNQDIQLTQETHSLSLEYKYRALNDELVLSLTDYNQALLQTDSTQTALHQSIDGEIQVGVRWSHQWGKVGFRINSLSTKDLSRASIRGNVNYSLPWLTLEYGLSSQRDTYEPTLFTADEYYDLLIQRDLSAFHQNYLFHIRQWTLSLNHFKYFSQDSETELVNPYSTLLLPASRCFGIDILSTNQAGSAYGVWWQFTQDTCNATIRENSWNIGKIYALDLKQQQFGITWSSMNYHASIAHHALSGEISGSILTAPFGSLLSLLSGARFYLQSTLELQYYDISSTYTLKFPNKANIHFGNRMYYGVGQIYAKTYIWQLFNPINDLNVADLKLDRFLLWDPSITVEYFINEDWLFSVNWNRLFPLILDYELSGTTNLDPDRDSDEVTGRLGSKYSLQLQYRLK